MAVSDKFDILYQKLLSEKTKKSSETIILVIAITSFLIHPKLRNRHFKGILKEFGVVPKSTKPCPSFFAECYF